MALRWFALAALLAHAADARIADVAKNVGMGMLYAGAQGTANQMLGLPAYGPGYGSAGYAMGPYAAGMGAGLGMNPMMHGGGLSSMGMLMSPVSPMNPMSVASMANPYNPNNPFSPMNPANNIVGTMNPLSLTSPMNPASPLSPMHGAASALNPLNALSPLSPLNPMNSGMMSGMGGMMPGMNGMMPGMSGMMPGMNGMIPGMGGMMPGMGGMMPGMSGMMSGMNGMMTGMGGVMSPMVSGMASPMMPGMAGQFPASYGHMPGTHIHTGMMSPMMTHPVGALNPMVQGMAIAAATNPLNPASPTNPRNIAHQVALASSPLNPANPGSPAHPQNPLNPANPANPRSPLSPLNPANPMSPMNPANPASPLNPLNRTAIGAQPLIASPAMQLQREQALNQAYMQRAGLVPGGMPVPLAPGAGTPYAGVVRRTMAQYPASLNAINPYAKDRTCPIDHDDLADIDTDDDPVFERCRDNEPPGQTLMRYGNRHNMHGQLNPAILPHGAMNPALVHSGMMNPMMAGGMGMAQMNPCGGAMNLYGGAMNPYNGGVSPYVNVGANAHTPFKPSLRGTILGYDHGGYPHTLLSKLGITPSEYEKRMYKHNAAIGGTTRTTYRRRFSHENPVRRLYEAVTYPFVRS